jgi:hypothetical protein
MPVSPINPNSGLWISPRVKLKELDDRIENVLSSFVIFAVEIEKAIFRRRDGIR